MLASTKRRPLDELDFVRVLASSQAARFVAARETRPRDSRSRQEGLTPTGAALHQTFASRFELRAFLRRETRDSGYGDLVEQRIDFRHGGVLDRAFRDDDLFLRWEIRQHAQAWLTFPESEIGQRDDSLLVADKQKCEPARGGEERELGPVSCR